MDRIYQLKIGKNNLYLIKDKENILIDTGTPGNYKKIIKKLEKIGINHIDYIFITHPHYDHVGNLGKLSERFNTKVVAHKKARKFLVTGQSSTPVPTNLFTKILISLMNRLPDRYTEFDSVDPDILLAKDTNLEEIQTEIRFLEVPGHTNDSIAIIYRSKYCFTGDACFNIPGIFFPPFAEKRELIIESWKKLIKTGATTFFPGHGKPFPLEKLEKKLKKAKPA